MLYRIVVALTASLSFCAATVAQMTPVGGSRGISLSATGVPTYSESAPFNVPMFSASSSTGSGGGWGNASIESSLTSSLWSLEGSAIANAQFAPAGTSVTTSASANLAFEVAAGTELHVDYWCQGTYGGFDSMVRVQGAGLNVIANGGQLGSGGSRTVFVTETATVYLNARGGGTGYSGSLTAFGNFTVTITATSIPSPSAAGLLGLAGIATLMRRRPRM